MLSVSRIKLEKYPMLCGNSVNSVNKMIKIVFNNPPPGAYLSNEANFSCIIMWDTRGAGALTRPPEQIYRQNLGKQLDTALTFTYTI